MFRENIGKKSTEKHTGGRKGADNKIAADFDLKLEEQKRAEYDKKTLLDELIHNIDKEGNVRDFLAGFLQTRKFESEDNFNEDGEEIASLFRKFEPKLIELYSEPRLSELYKEIKEFDREDEHIDQGDNSARLYEKNVDQGGSLLIRLQIIKSIHTFFIHAFNDEPDNLVCDTVLRDLNKLLEEDKNSALESLLILQTIREAVNSALSVGRALEPEATRFVPELANFDNIDKDGFKRNIIADFHDHKYDVLKIAFNDNAKQRLVELDSKDIQINEAVENHNRFKPDILDRTENPTDDDYKFWDGANDRDAIDTEDKSRLGYIICDLSPEFLGVYNQEGVLLGWKELNNEIKTAISNGHKITTNLNYFSFNSQDDKVVFNSLEELTSFKILNSLSLRKTLKDEFNIDMARFPVRVQRQLQQFLSDYSLEDLEKLKVFFNGTDQARDNKVTSFLSLESNSDIGNKMLEINEFLATQPVVADKFFAKHAKLINQINYEANSFAELYDGVFFGKNIDREKLISLSLKRTNLILLMANKNLETAPEEAKGKIIDDLIDDLDKEAKSRTINIEELKIMAQNLNEKYNSISQDLYSSLNPGEKLSNTLYELERALDSDEDDLQKGINYVRNFDLDNLEYYEDDYCEDEVEYLKEEAKRHQKYDSSRLREIIKYYQFEVGQEREPLPPYQRITVEGEWGNEEMRKQFEMMQDRQQASDALYPSPGQVKSYYQETINKLQQILPLQIALEKKMDQIIYGREEAALPKGFSNFENDPVRPENIPNQTPLYFPVGISKDLPSWEAVLNGEKKVVKPIDIYGYLFWLNNQERPINLIVCDEIQVNNYQIRYGQAEKESREKAIKIGDREALQYKKIIDTFGLRNIRIQGYSEFLMQNKDKYEYYKEAVTSLADRPDFKEVFLSMVQDSVSGAEQEKYINYALEELAWILSTNGTKIGHLNEARYDILGAVISNWEKLGREKGFDVFKDQTNPESKILLNTVCKGLRDEINERKSKLDKNSSAAAYYQRLQEHLGKIKINNKIGLDKKFKKDSLSLNFVCPEVGSASFGFRGDFEAKEGVVKFKEPYSTYFYKTDADLLTDSDQVVAAGEGSIGGKILTLDNKQQLKYANQVVRPILKHYFASLDRVPLKYFEKIGKSRKELQQDSGEIASLLDAIRFIQKYIIRPTELV